MRILIAVIALCVSSFGQTAKVIQLSPEDAAKAKSLHEAALKAQADEDEFTSQMRDKYLLVEQSSKDAGCNTYRRKGEKQVKFMSGTGTITYSSPGTFLLSDGTLRNDEKCLTPEEKAAIAKREARAKQRAEEVEIYEKSHPYLYWRSGWCDGLEFTEDFRFIVPKAAPKYEKSPNWITPATWTAQ